MRHAVKFPNTDNWQNNCTHEKPINSFWLTAASQNEREKRYSQYEKFCIQIQSFVFQDFSPKFFTLQRKRIICIQIIGEKEKFWWYGVVSVI